MGTVELEIDKLKQELQDLRKKVDLMMEERQSVLAMIMAEHSLKDFFSDEPILYSEKDLKVKY
jgi:hypothetical protein